ncbi:hypothetical protein M378DRAFT_1029324, partial [Amanita muscaria Koide BX008]
GDKGHSSSIVDLFDSLRSPTFSLLPELEWADAYQEARFFTSLSKAPLFSAPRRPVQVLPFVENLFLTEMLSHLNEYLEPQSPLHSLRKPTGCYGRETCRAVQLPPRNMH